MTHNFICEECGRSRDISSSFIIKWSLDKNRWGGQKSDLLLRRALDIQSPERYYHIKPILKMIMGRKTKKGEKLCGPLKIMTEGDILFRELSDILKKGIKRMSGSGIIRVYGLNKSKHAALLQSMDPTYIKSSVSVFRHTKNGIEEIKSLETHKNSASIEVPGSKKEYFVRVSSEFFTPFVSKKFDVGYGEKVDIAVQQHDLDNPLPDFHGDKKEAMKAYLLAKNWRQKDDGWHSRHESCITNDVEKAYFFQEYLRSQGLLTQHIDELQEIQQENPAVWEKFCWDTFKKKTKDQWNVFVAETIMEELDG